MYYQCRTKEKAKIQYIAEGGGGRGRKLTVVTKDFCLYPGLDWKSLLIRAPQKGPEKRCRAKIVEKCRKTFLTFFLTIFDVFFALRENCRKVSKNFLTLFDVF